MKIYLLWLIKNSTRELSGIYESEIEAKYVMATLEERHHLRDGWEYVVEEATMGSYRGVMAGLKDLEGGKLSDLELAHYDWIEDIDD